MIIYTHDQINISNFFENLDTCEIQRNIYIYFLLDAY